MNAPSEPAEGGRTAAIARQMQDAIGLRVGAISTLRLSNAVRELAESAGVGLESVPGMLGEGTCLRQELVDRVTVQESSFFRDAPFFAALATEILPGLPDPLIVWSAGCAHGQEAFSLAMLLAESGRSNWRILATDVSEAALTRARLASYSSRELRGLTPERQARFLVPDADGRLRIADPLRAELRFGVHNLAAGPLPPVVAGARLVLLRNVLIYFDEAARRAVLRQLASTLPAGAWILLGGSELVQEAPGLDIVRVGGVFAHRVRAAGAPPPPAVGASESNPPLRRRVLTRPPEPTAAPETLAAPEISLPTSDRARLIAEAERHAGAGHHPAAIRLLRQVVYADPDDLAARLALALMLEAAGDADAGRAFRATLTLARRGTSDRTTTFEGYRIGEVERMIEERLHELETRR